MANYKTKEALEMLSINRNLLDALKKAGLIKSHKIGRNYVYSDSDIQEFLDVYIGKKISKEGIVLNER